MRQNNLSVDRFDDLWIGPGSLKSHNRWGGMLKWTFADLFKKRLKIRASHVSIKYNESPHTDVCCSRQIFATPKLDWG